MKTLLFISAVAIFANYAHSLPYSINEKIRGLKNGRYTFENRPCRSNKLCFKKCNLYYDLDYNLKEFELIKETKDYDKDEKEIKEYIADKLPTGSNYNISKITKAGKIYICLQVKEFYFVRKANKK